MVGTPTQALEDMSSIGYCDKIDKIPSTIIDSDLMFALALSSLSMPTSG